MELVRVVTPNATVYHNSNCDVAEDGALSFEIVEMTKDELTAVVKKDKNSAKHDCVNQ